MLRSFRYGILIAVSALLLGPAFASAAPGDLTHQGCLSGSDAATPCTHLASSTADGSDSGLSNPRDVAVSADGASLYAAVAGDAAVAHFARDPGTGSLTFLGCIAGDTGATPAPCAATPDATAGGDGSGLEGLNRLVISPDGTSLHATAPLDDSVVSFSRNPAGGALTYAGCVSGDDDVPACTRIAGAVSGGADTGLSNPDSITISPGSEQVYAGLPGGGVAILDRIPSTGSLAYRGCISGDSDTPCELIPGAVSNATDTGLESLRDLVAHPDGGSVYTVSDSDESVVHFSRAGDGSLGFAGCISGANSIPNCDPIPGATPNGDQTGMRSIVAVAVSPDGGALFTAADDDEAIANIALGAGGSPSFAGCFSGDTGVTNCTPIPGATDSAADSGLDFTRAVATSPDSRSVYGFGASDRSVVTFSRDPGSGNLTFADCQTTETETAACLQLPGAGSMGLDSGFDRPTAGFVSPDGRALYVTADADDSITHFTREEFVAPPAPTPDPPAPTPEPEPEPDPPPADPDTVAPELEIKGRKRSRNLRRLLVKLTADEAATAKVVATLKVPRGRRPGAGGAKATRFKLRKTGIALEADERRKVRLKLKKRHRRAVKKALRRGRKPKAKLVATATDAAGNRSAKAKFKVKIRRKKKGRRG